MQQKLRCIAESHCMCLAREFPRGEPIREKKRVAFQSKLASLIQSLLSIKVTWLHKSQICVLSSGCPLWFQQPADETMSLAVAWSSKISKSFRQCYAWVTHGIYLRQHFWFLIESNAASRFKSQDLTTIMWQMPAHAGTIGCASLVRCGLALQRASATSFAKAGSCLSMTASSIKQRQDHIFTAPVDDISIYIYIHIRWYDYQWSWMIYTGYRAGQLHGATVPSLIAEVTNAFRQLLWLRMRDVPGGSVDPFVRVLTITVMCLAQIAEARSDDCNVSQQGQEDLENI